MTKTLVHSHQTARHPLRTLGLAISRVQEHRGKIIIGLFSVLVFATSSYIYFVHQAVLNVVARQNILKEIALKNKNISTLENQYFTIENSITESMAFSKGFKSATVENYISAKPQGQALTFNNEL